jgi:hypothetical protein
MSKKKPITKLTKLNTKTKLTKLMPIRRNKIKNLMINNIKMLLVNLDIPRELLDQEEFPIKKMIKTKLKPKIKLTKLMLVRNTKVTTTNPRIAQNIKMLVRMLVLTTQTKQ